MLIGFAQQKEYFVNQRPRPPRSMPERMVEWHQQTATANSFSRGEAVRQIGSSEPICLTDEERRKVTTRYAAGKYGNGTIFR